MTIIPDIVESDIVKVIDKKNLFFTIQKRKRMKTFYSTIIMNALKSLGLNGKIQQLISIRLKLHIDESRIWKVDMENVKRHSFMVGFMWNDSIVRSLLNITGTEKDLSAMTIFQKIIYLRNYSKEVHKTNRDDVFYCYYNKPDTVLSHYSNTKLFFIGKN